MTENYTQNDGSTAYKLTGLSVDILKMACEKMNLTTIFLAPPLNLDFDSYVKEISELDEGLSDVLTGVIPLMPFVVTSSFDATIPYTHETLTILVPCLKDIPGTQNLMTTFSLCVWLTMGLVLLLTTAVFWCAGNVPYRSVCNVRHTHISHCSNVSTMLGLCLWEYQFHSSPQILPSQFSSFSTSVSVSLLALYSKNFLFLLW